MQIEWTRILTGEECYDLGRIQNIQQQNRNSEKLRYQSQIKGGVAYDSNVVSHIHDEWRKWCSGLTVPDIR